MKSTPSGSVQSETKTPPDKPSATLRNIDSYENCSAGHLRQARCAPAKAGCPGADALGFAHGGQVQAEYGSGIEPLTYLGQNYMVVDRSLIPEILQVLRNEEQFDYCVDMTAVHYPKREKQFDVVWMLYSFARNERIRVKTQIADGESLPSSVPSVGDVRTGWSAKCMTCSESSSTGIRI